MFCYNEILSILAVGTKTGHLRIYGKPGVEFTFMHPTRLPVTNIFFPSNSKTFLTICSDDSLYLWSIPGPNTSKNCIVTISSEASNIRNINCSCMGNYLYLSTTNNSIYAINPETLQTIDNKFICKESLYNSLMDSTNFNKPSLITTLQLSKHISDKLFIGLSNLTIILWDLPSGSAMHVYNMQQSIEHISFLIDESEFVVSHSDGSYSIWSCDFPRQSDHPTSPYGPFPCKAITQLRIFGQKEDPYIVFTGGMPRSSHGEKQTVTCMTSSSHIVFEFPSKVISFIIVPEPSEIIEDYTLLVLCEEELIAIDLSADNWPLLNLPYMNCMHRSPVLSTCISFDVKDSLWKKLIENVAQDEKEWPIKGGEIVNNFLACKDVIFTGHENGTICIWNLRTGTYITKIFIEKFLEVNNPKIIKQHISETEDEWPPFRKVGEFCIYSPNMKLAIQKILMIPNEEILIVGASNGQVLIMKMLVKDPTARNVDILNMDMVTGRVSRHSGLNSNIDHNLTNGYQSDSLPNAYNDEDDVVSFRPIRLLQMSPMCAVSALAWHQEWKILGIGTTCGYAAYDFIQDKCILTRSTYVNRDPINKQNLHNSSQVSLNKSWRDSIRSFRSRSTRTNRHSNAHRVREHSVPVPCHNDSKAGASTVLCIAFADTFLHSSQTKVASMWIGTNTGLVVAQQFNIGSLDIRNTYPITCGFTREIQMRSMAPVHVICVTDKNMKFPTSSSAASSEASPNSMAAINSNSMHQVIICCEDGIKIRNLPTLRTSRRSRFMFRLKKATLSVFTSKSDSNYSEFGIVCITENGQFCLLNLPSLMNQFPDTGLLFQIYDFNSTSFDAEGNVVIQRSQSEFLHISLSTRSPKKTKCHVLVE